MPKRPTALITFEGADGAGKTTLFLMTIEHLESKGFKVLTIREPGGTPASEIIRDLLLHGPDMASMTELLLYMAARAENYQTVIKKALGVYNFIIADRSIDSSVAYQGYARGLPIEDIQWLNNFATGGLKPNVTYLLDIDTVTAFSRMKEGALDRIEREPIAFQNAVRHGFLELAKKEPNRFVVIDASQKPDECFRAVKADLYRRFSEY